MIIVVVTLITILIMINIFMFISVFCVKRNKRDKGDKIGLSFMEVVFVANIIALLWGWTR